MILNKEKGEFNFTLSEDSKTKFQYQARYLGEDSQAVRGLGYSMTTIKKLTKQEYKTQRYLNRITAKAQAANVDINSLGILNDHG